MTLAQWFSHRGRISRKTWWIFYCLAWFCLFCVLVETRRMILLGVETPQKSSVAEYIIITVFKVLGLMMLWIGFAGLIKRWHDQGKSGWSAALLFVPIILYPLFLIFFSFVDLNGFGGLDHRWMGGIFALMSLLLFVPVFVACAVAGFQPGTRGPNRFGPDPLAPPDAANIALPPQPQ
jgi:uncharacterized membrane protein YhaH (DUF805 family)